MGLHQVGGLWCAWYLHRWHGPEPSQWRIKASWTTLMPRPSCKLAWAPTLASKIFMTPLQLEITPAGQFTGKSWRLNKPRIINVWCLVLSSLFWTMLIFSLRQHPRPDQRHVLLSSNHILDTHISISRMARRRCTLPGNWSDHPCSEPVRIWGFQSCATTNFFPQD